MKVEKTSVNCAEIDIQGEHTHTSFEWDKDALPKAHFKEVHITYSDFPEGVAFTGVHVDTFPNGAIYVCLPRNIDILIRLNKKVN